MPGHRDIYDPFERAHSVDGRPTVPKLLTPPDRSQFSYYPRLVDLRWTPSAGDEPMAYDVELEIEAGRHDRLRLAPDRASGQLIAHEHPDARFQAAG